MPHGCADGRRASPSDRLTRGARHPGSWSSRQWGQVTLTKDPGAPPRSIATAGNAVATVRRTAPEANGGPAILKYTAVSNPGSKTCSTVRSNEDLYGPRPHRLRQLHLPGDRRQCRGQEFTLGRLERCQTYGPCGIGTSRHVARSACSRTVSVLWLRPQSVAVRRRRLHRSGSPGRGGSTGAARSSAWICDSSSTCNTSAPSGRFTYNPTMSRTLSMNSGSGDSLTVSRRTPDPADGRLTHGRGLGHQTRRSVRGVGRSLREGLGDDSLDRRVGDRAGRPAARLVVQPVEPTPLWL